MSLPDCMQGPSEPCEGFCLVRDERDEFSRAMVAADRRANALLALVQNAPHADDCSSHNAPFVYETTGLGHMVKCPRFNECDCWKTEVQQYA